MSTAISSGEKARSSRVRRKEPCHDGEGRDGQRDLEGRVERDAHGEVEIAAPGDLDGGEVLGDVADQRDDDQADEDRTDAGALDRRFDGVHQDLAEYAGQNRRDRRTTIARRGDQRAWPWATASVSSGD